MFVLKPTASLTGKSVPTDRPVQRATPSSLFRGLALSRRTTNHHRRASDALGLRGPAASPFFISTAQQPAQPGTLVIDYMGNDWLSPEENLHLQELDHSADQLTLEMAQADRDLAALSAQQEQAGLSSADLSLTAQHTFSRIDTLMQRWSLRAEQVEQTSQGGQLMAFNPVTGHRLGHVPLRGPTGRALPATQRSLTPQRVLPATGNGRHGDQRQQVKQALVSSIPAPSAQIRLRRFKLNGKVQSAGVGKDGLLRQKLNQLASAPAQTFSKAANTRRIALARLASLHGNIDHLAQELHEHRRLIEANTHHRRHKRPHAAPAAPVLKPKVKTDGKI